MRLVLVVLLSLVAGTFAKSLSVGHHSTDDEDCEEDPHLLEISHDLGDLTADVVGFEDLLTKGGERAKHVDSELREVKTRINNLGSSGCDDRTQFQCGGSNPLCLSRLLVCDGQEDCANGEDETQCVILTPTDSEWHAEMLWDHCTKARPETFELHIENYHVIDYIKSYPLVDAHLHVTSKTHEYDASALFHLHGWMDLKPGNHIMYFPPPETDGLAISCIFDGVHDDHCHGQVLFEKSQEVCAEFFLQRQD